MKKKKFPITGLFLLILLVFLGSWGLPEWFMQRHDVDNPPPDFPIALEMPNQEIPHRFLSTVSEVNRGVYGVIQKVNEPRNSQVIYSTFFQEQPVDFETDNYHVYLTPINNHYELKLVAPILTITHVYSLADNKAYPISTRTTGWIMWLYAAGIVVLLTLTIALIQFGLGIVRSATISPRAKKRSQKMR